MQSPRGHCEQTPLRIFVVEDHADTLTALTWYLEELGHTVISAVNMGSALEKLPGATFDVLISDIGLPDGNGWELLRTVRSERNPDSFYAIAISAFGRAEYRARSAAAGYRQHLLKPLELQKLDCLLEEAAGMTLRSM